MQQFIQTPQQAQLPLLEAFLAQPALPGLKPRYSAGEKPRKGTQQSL